MKKLLLAMAAVSGLAVAAPAAAQFSGDHWESTRDWDRSREDRLGALERRIEMDVRRGIISRYELPRLRQLLWQARTTKDRYARGGFNGWERGDVDQSIDRLNAEVHFAEMYENGRRVENRGYPANGWDDRGGGYDDNGAWADVDDGWDRDEARDRDDDDSDDRGYDQSGRWNDSRSSDRGDNGWNDDDDRDGGGWTDRDAVADDQPGGGQWNGGQSPNDRPGVNAGGAGDLRVGDPAPVNLGAVPDEFRSRYPDGSGVYYRYDGGRIFQVDSRTNLIRWIGSVD